MALNVKILENLPHPVEDIKPDETPVHAANSGQDGSKNNEELLNDSKRMSLIKSYIKQLYLKRKNQKESARKKVRKIADAIKKLNIL